MILENPIVNFGSLSESHGHHCSSFAFVKLYFSLEVTLATNWRKIGLAAALFEEID